MRRRLLALVLLTACGTPPERPDVTLVGPVRSRMADGRDLPAGERLLVVDARLLEARADELASLGLRPVGGPVGLDVLDAARAGGIPVPGPGPSCPGPCEALVWRGEAASFWFRCPGGAVGLTIDGVEVGPAAAGFDVRVRRFLIGPPDVDLAGSRRIELADGATALLQLGPEGPGRLLLLTVRSRAVVEDR